MTINWKTVSLLAGIGFGFLAYYYKDLKINYGWLPDIPDPRDYVFSPRSPEAELPLTVNLSSKCSPVEAQGNLGSCTAHAITSALEYLDIVNGEKLVDLSRLFVYYNERVITNTVEKDSGAYLRDGMKTLKTDGVCSEEQWRYVISQFRTQPPSIAYSEASKHKITSYERLDDLDDMKQCLRDGFPFVFGFIIYKSFESAEVSQTGILNMPKSGEVKKGGHAVLAVGYDESTQRFLVRNSWGPSWGINGYFTIPFTYLQDPSLSGDFWVIRKDS